MRIKLDQHMMVDIKVLEKIVAASELVSGERVLEIGAGTGNLTRILSSTKAKITAVELDPQIAAVLKERFSSDRNITIIEGNALKLIKKLEFDKIVSNIPYAICEPLMVLLRKVNFKLAVLTVPKRFLKNITSDSKLGLETSIFFEIKTLFDVPKGAFAPEPDTESVVILVKPRKTILGSVLTRPNAKLKNAIMEALVEARKCTKNQAREAIKAFKISNIVGEKPVADMNLNDLRQLISKIKD